MMSPEWMNLIFALGGALLSWFAARRGILPGATPITPKPVIPPTAPPPGAVGLTGNPALDQMLNALMSSIQREFQVKIEDMVKRILPPPEVPNGQH